jgi:hypothetical protein
MWVTDLPVARARATSPLRPPVLHCHQQRCVVWHGVQDNTEPLVEQLQQRGAAGDWRQQSSSLASSPRSPLRRDRSTGELMAGSRPATPASAPSAASHHGAMWQGGGGNSSNGGGSAPFLPTDDCGSALLESAVKEPTFTLSALHHSVAMPSNGMASRLR